jgi:SAM-dependent MidA family methyltransferase
MPFQPEHSNLPPLSAQQREQAAAVLTAVRAAIAAAGGWLPFDEYLQLVMYAPGLGYYSAGSAKFGADGDFVTAPELSSLFGYCVARQCAPLLGQLRAAGAGVDVMELGAGSGRLALDVLTRLATLDVLPDRYLILEVSGELRARQQSLLTRLPPDLRQRVVWLDALPAQPLHAVILANEVADALPFKRFVVGTQAVNELGVTIGATGALQLGEQLAVPALLTEYQRMMRELPAVLPPGYVSECCPLLEGWIAGLAHSLAAGAILLLDYGVGRSEYYHAERSRGTLRCHYRHRAHDDALLHPGLQDITAWVDFTRVAEAASANGLTVSAYCTQAAFLLGAGIDAELSGELSALQRARLASAARQLLLPGEMGESFKCIALAKHCEIDAQHFAPQDLRRQL